MRVLGIDAGANAGWASLDVDRAGTAQWLGCGVLRREARVADLVEVLRDEGPDLALVVVEMPIGQLFKGRHPGAVEELMNARDIGRELEVTARAWASTLVCTATVVRKALCLRVGASDADVERALRLLVPDWPKARTTQTHERDAALAALWGARTKALTELGLFRAPPAAAETKKRVRRAGGEKR